ncbi:DUF692 domain-containing protein [Neisseriaceae bacterium TC5R-5]|nr:DUF692 domain-containing protein [Neisseriaceae bacterium TC5R-5]
MAGLGYRREMASWDMTTVHADFFEVAPENWISRDLAPLQQLVDSGRPVHLHGVSLNLGGTAPINRDFLSEVAQLIDDLGVSCYSDHLSASGDAHQLYDLFPIPFTEFEAQRLAGRICQVQDILGMQIAVENITWYTNIGEMPEIDFIDRVVTLADCKLLLDLNNIAVNHKNHGSLAPEPFINALDLHRVSYIHVAGHEFDDRFSLYLDTHSQPVEKSTQSLAQQLNAKYSIPILLEWDNDVPSLERLNQELSCLKTSTIS